RDQALQARGENQGRETREDEDDAHRDRLQADAPSHLVQAAAQVDRADLLPPEPDRAEHRESPGLGSDALFLRPRRQADPATSPVAGKEASPAVVESRADDGGPG